MGQREGQWGGGTDPETPQETKFRNNENLKGKRTISWCSAWDQGREIQVELPKLARELIAVCGDKLQEIGRSITPHQENRRR